MIEVLKLKKLNCKNCYKCIRYCPVKAIRFTGSQAHVINNECILCGQCFVACPQNAKEIVDSSNYVNILLASGEKVIASVAPSFVAYFEKSGIGSVEKALKKLGFYAAEETAIGATIVKNEYERLIKEKKGENIISSCCHSINLLIGKYYPELVRYLAPVVTPMQAHCIDIKRRYPDAKTVFIGPCIAKKDEVHETDAVDAVLTFGELSRILESLDIEIEADNEEHNEKSKTRLFPTVGGIIKSMNCEGSPYTYVAIDGIERCKAALDDLAEGKIKNCFIEMSSCEGSCIGGPIMEKTNNSPVTFYSAVNSYAGKDDFDVEQPDSKELAISRKYMGISAKMPDEKQIQEVLSRMGKIPSEKELNCGTCGYNTCREKAIAIIQGKADINMCLPFLMEKSERFSKNILDNTPDGIIVVNEELIVQQINAAAMRMLNINMRSDILGESIMKVMDPVPFLEVLDGSRRINNHREYYSEYGKYFEHTIVYDRNSNIMISILHDVTEAESSRHAKEELVRQTAEIADRVVEKQMRIVQEIASLLGETAAETKIALTKLKESMPHDEE